METKTSIIIKANRDSSLDTMKGILIIMVIVGHICGDATFGHGFFESFIFFINLIHMPVFIFISGYLSKNVSKNKERARKSFSQLILFQICSFLFSILVGDGRYYSNWMLPGMALWYLAALVVWRYTIEDFMKIKHIITISFVLGCGLCLINDTYPNLLAMPKIIGEWPFFLLGFYCSREKLDKIKKMNILLPILLMIIGLGYAFYIRWYLKLDLSAITHYTSFKNYYHEVADNSGELVTQALEGLLITIVTYIINVAVGIAFINIVCRIRIKFISDRIGKNTLPLYILSNYFQYAMFLFQKKFRFPHVYQNIILGLVASAITIWICSNKTVVKYFNLTTEKFRKMILK